MSTQITNGVVYESLQSLDDVNVSLNYLSALSWMPAQAKSIQFFRAIQ